MAALGLDASNQRAYTVARMIGAPPVGGFVSKWYLLLGALDARSMLIIGVLISMFSAIFVTRMILRLVVDRSWSRAPWLYGVSASEMVLRPTGRPTRRGVAGGV